MRRNPVLVCIVATTAIATSHAPLAQSDLNASGDLSVIDQISPPEESSAGIGQMNPADRAAAVEEQAPSVADGTCASASEVQRRLLGLTCIGDDELVLSDGRKADLDGVVLHEDGAYVRVSPQPAPEDDEREEILGLPVASE